MYRTRQGSTSIVLQGDVRGGVVVRETQTSDEAALLRLAALDDQRALNGRVVVAEIDGEIVSAVELVSGRSIADPWRRTDELTRLAQMRADQLRRAQGAARAPVRRVGRRALSPRAA
jgi:hypothetical protein